MGKGRRQEPKLIRFKDEPLKPESRVIDTATVLLLNAIHAPEVIPELTLTDAAFPLGWQRDLWGVIQQLSADHSNIDLMIVVEMLERTFTPCPEKGWLGFLGALMRETVIAPSNVKYHAQTLMDYAARARCAEIGRTLWGKAVNGEDGSDEAVRDLMAMSTIGPTLDGPLAESVGDAIDALDARHKNTGKVPGIPYWLIDLDMHTGGMFDGNLIILAARPSIGKTGFALGVATHNASAGTPVGFYSTEQPRIEMINRIASIRARVNSHAMRLGKLNEEDWTRLTPAMMEIGQWPFYMNDSPAPHVNEVARQARKWKHRYGIKLLIVDYIQRCKAPECESRNAEVGFIARALKELARELSIPVLALCQINRGVEARTDKRPNMGDLRDSGDIEQEADVIATLYRDEVYHDDARNKGTAEVGIIKDRHGPTGRVYLAFEHFTASFTNYLGQLGSVDLGAPAGVAGGNGAPQRKVGSRQWKDRRAETDG